MNSAATDSKPSMTIGKLSEATGATIDTIRFYEKCGLLPKPARTASGYRKYSSEDELRLGFVARARLLGFSLDEIGEMLRLRTTRSGSVARVREVAQMKVAVIEQKIAELEQLRTALKALVGACPGDGAPESCPILNAFSGSERA
jgi:MerR family transcriptional regulator, copper efflux regulator